MKLYQVSPQDFAQHAPTIHRVVFNEMRDIPENRYNYVLVCADETQMFAYSTIIEMDDETAYMQHGGALPNAQGTIRSKVCYRLMVNWLKERYKRISTRIQNTNVPMIKFALSEGLIIDGCFAYRGGDVFLSLGWGF